MEILIGFILNFCGNLVDMGIIETDKDIKN